MVGVAIEHPPLVTSCASPHLVVIGGVVIVVWSFISTVTGIVAEVDAMGAAVEFVLSAYHGALLFALGAASFSIAFPPMSTPRLCVVPGLKSHDTGLKGSCLFR